MLFFRVAYTILALGLVTSEELSTKEKIRIHKEWLERRAALKTQYLNSNGTEKASYYRKIMKLQTEKNIPNLKNDTSLQVATINSRNKIFDKGERRSNDVLPEYDGKTFTTTTTTTTPSPTIFPKETTTPKYIRTTTKNTPLTAPSSNIKTTTSATTTSTENPLLSTTASTIYSSSMNEAVSFNRSHATASAPKRTRSKKFPHWGPWSAWSECSRTCGGGVMFQQRKCILRRSAGQPRRIILSRECAGLNKRYHLCNEQDCPPSETDFRHHQCASYDNQLFQGKMYKWEPYIKDDAECELNCKPIGMRYFATLNDTVIDGTTCSRPAEYYRKNYRGKAICVGGICKAIHASGVIAGTFVNSGTVHCGGLICRPITGIFTKPHLQIGYTHVATIPAGASNISITELKHSRNYLVLKTGDKKYIFNGDYTVSPSSVFEGAGAAFDYRRIDGVTANQDPDNIEGVTEWITCTGPTTEPVHLMVLAHYHNPGIKYEYLLPIMYGLESEEDIYDSSASAENDNFPLVPGDNSLNVRLRDYSSTESTAVRSTGGRRKKFMWKVVGFSPCSKSCGGGMQAPTIRCVRDSPSRYVSARRCSQIEKPVLNENLLRCNTQPCPAYWRIDDWADCKCYQGQGTREREIRCVQELATGIVIQVNSAACLDEQPTNKKKCECPKGRRRNSQRGERQRVHAHSRGSESIISNATAHTAKPAVDNSKAGVWLLSNWNQHCSAECGTGTEYRSIFCDRSPPNSERCDFRFTPDTSRPCENERTCDTGEWFTSSWGQCTGDCFNITKSRQIHCIRNRRIVDPDECRFNERPISVKNCTTEDVEYCKPRWHYSEWSECTKTCDGGNQRRTVKCLEQDIRENTLKESEKCRYSDREPIYRGCNTHKCLDPRVDLIQNDIEPTCADQFSNCHLVVKAKLCSYEYYRQNCCYSCNNDINQ